MRHHEHYLGWTIESEENNGYDREYWICTQCIDIETDSIKTARYSVDVLSVDKCKELIRNIIADQITAARKIIASYHYELNDGIPTSAYDDSDDDDSEVTTIN